MTLFLSEVVGSSSGVQFIRALYNTQTVDLANLNEFMTACGANYDNALLAELQKAGVIFESGDKLYLSTKGKQCFWLVSAINGGSLSETVSQVVSLVPTLLPYELVTEGMTERFIEELTIDYNFKSLLLCSPWICLRPRILEKLSYALYRAQEKDAKIEFVVITRPLNKKDRSFSDYIRTLRGLTGLGAEVVLKERLHTKLYIRERSISGRTSQAIFGSENLTGSRNIELGIKINNDTGMIRRLSRYFFDLYQNSTVLKSEDLRNESIC